jgi:hypothetical protein
MTYGPGRGPMPCAVIFSPGPAGPSISNFFGQEGQERVIAGFGPENYRRLAEIKARYDPGNVSSA